MKQAKALSEILRVTQRKPLTGGDFDMFFVNTDEARGYQAALLLAGTVQRFFLRAKDFLRWLSRDLILPLYPLTKLWKKKKE